jgi:putative ABC transport system permease protein
MIDIEKWREILGTLGRHKLRTTLTAFGVFWGIFMLTVLLGAGKGLENGVAMGFPRVTNTVYVWRETWPAWASSPGRIRSASGAAARLT